VWRSSRDSLFPKIGEAELHLYMATSKELYDSIAKDDWDGVKSLLDRGLAADAPFSIDYVHLPCTPLQ